MINLITAKPVYNRPVALAGNKVVSSERENGKVLRISKNGFQTEEIFKKLGEMPILKTESQFHFQPTINTLTFGARKPAMPKEKASPEEVLKEILAVQSPTEAKETKEIIDNIVNEIEKADSILAIGHDKPDADTVGGTVGLTGAIKFAHPEKQVDAAIDDNNFSLDMKKVLSTEKLKFPYEHMESLKAALPGTPTQRHLIGREINNLENRILEKDKKYDLVMLVDIPSPDKLSDRFKSYIKNAKKVILIDHHKDSFARWSSKNSCIDVKKLKQEKSYWVDKKVPAASQMTAIIAARVAPELNKVAQNPGLALKYEPEKQANLAQFAKNTALGIYFDTGKFYRKADAENLDFKPPEMFNWLSALTSKLKPADEISVSRYWKEFDPKNFPYGTAQKINEFTDREARKNSRSGKSIIVNTDYNKLNEFLTDANKKKTLHFFSIRDIYEKVKSATRIKSGNQTKVSVYFSQLEKKGCLTGKGIANKDNLLISCRSPRSNKANLIISIFGGGGHSSVAGANIEADNVNARSKVAVLIDGEEVLNSKKIVSALRKNDEIKQGKIAGKKSDIQYKLKDSGDSKYQNFIELIDGLVGEMSKEDQLSA